MIGVLGDSNTKEEILEGFKLINKGAEITKVEYMTLVMGGILFLLFCWIQFAEHEVEYIKKTAPAVEGGYDYKKWTEDVFSR